MIYCLRWNTSLKGKEDFLQFFLCILFNLADNISNVGIKQFIHTYGFLYMAIKWNHMMCESMSNQSVLQFDGKTHVKQKKN